MKTLPFYTDFNTNIAYHQFVTAWFAKKYKHYDRYATYINACWYRLFLAAEAGEI